MNAVIYAKFPLTIWHFWHAFYVERATHERLLRQLATLFWPAVEMQDGGVWGYVMAYHVG